MAAAGVASLKAGAGYKPAIEVDVSSTSSEESSEILTSDSSDDDVGRDGKDKFGRDAPRSRALDTEERANARDADKKKSSTGNG